MDVEKFITRWKGVGGAERGNYQLFIRELTDLLAVDPANPARGDDSDDYAFDRRVQHLEADSTTTNFIDLYKRNCFVLEAKQGNATAAEQRDAKTNTNDKKIRNINVRGTSAWKRYMRDARAQAANYAADLPEDHERPPFIIVADIGYCFDLYANFKADGRAYTPFPSVRRNRILVEDLRDPRKLELLKQIWTDPFNLDPALVSERVTREVSTQLGEIAKSLEADGNDPLAVAQFLARSLFTMFAEDIGLLPKAAFTRLLESVQESEKGFERKLEHLWREMDSGTDFSVVLDDAIRKFNGGLFKDCRSLPLNAEQRAMLLEAARKDWRQVEPAVFGTLLERALDPTERHKLGAHYTPRSYVERLVQPTIMEPLRRRWQAAQAAAETHLQADDKRSAEGVVVEFLKQLTATTVLDPACGSGNFLYVAMELMKGLEAEVLDTLGALHGGEQYALPAEFSEVSPKQFLGIELNERAATMAELVLWIGYIQLWYKNHPFEERQGPPEPILENLKTIEHRDALLTYDEADRELVRDEVTGKPITRWDGRSLKVDPTTGLMVPDTAKQVEIFRITNYKLASWPAAEFIVGNPPFQGGKDLRAELGEGYVTALWRAYKDIPDAADFVMYWWHRAAEQVAAGHTQRFGFVTTNSISQTFNRRVVQRALDAKKPLSLIDVIPDHPWVDGSGNAAVRIAMTVAEQGGKVGQLWRIRSETKVKDSELRDVELLVTTGKVWSNLRIGPRLSAATPLRANERLASRGVSLHGAGFIVTPDQAKMLSHGSNAEDVIFPYMNARDLNQKSRGVMVIDLFGLPEDQVKGKHPAIYQWVKERVKPERDQNRRATYRDNWLVFGEPRSELRKALVGLPRYIATAETSKHRFFTFFDGSVKPDNRLLAVGLADGLELSVLSSSVHMVWALANGGTLEDRPVYQKTNCFDTFPFPDFTDIEVASQLERLGEELDAHRKRQQAQHPDLTLTGMYNVLEKLRAGEELTDADREINNKGLVSTLLEIHDAIDAVTFAAYGWPDDLTDQKILEHVLALNLERAAEEAAGKVRWLRSEFQDPEGAADRKATAKRAETEELFDVPSASTEKARWPKQPQDRIVALSDFLATRKTAAPPDFIASGFKNARRKDVASLLETMATIGAVRKTDDGRFGALR